MLWHLELSQLPDEAAQQQLALWARAPDIRPGFDVVVGRYGVVGDEDADPRVARIVALDPDGNIELEVLHGAVESHLDLLARA